MKGALAASTAMHAAAALVLFVARPSHTLLVPGPDVVQVGLVDATTAEPPPAPPSKAAPENVTPAEEKGVRIEKPKKNKPEPERAAPARTPPPAPAPAAPTQPAQVVLPYASVGGGMAGQVAVDASNFEFAYYLQQVRLIIARNWTPAQGAAPGTRAEIYFRVARDGSLSAPRVETSSGNAYFDQAAARAVIVTDHLPPLPLGYSGADLGIHFGFEFTGR